MPAPITGQATGTGLGNPIALTGAPISCQAFIVKAPLTNSAAVYIGSSSVSSATGFQLDAGAELTYTRNIYQTAGNYQLEPSDFWMCGTSGDKVTWLASP